MAGPGAGAESPPPLRSLFGRLARLAAHALLWGALGAGAPGCGPGERREQPPDGPREELIVFAAASLAEVLAAVAEAFEGVHPGVEVVVNPAASSLLARQIEAGAPADVFVSADLAWARYLVDAGRAVGPVALLAGNRLVVIGPPGSEPWEAVSEGAAATPLALADPAHVPAGRYARSALSCLGIWEEAEPAVIPLLDVRAVLHAVRIGAVPAGIVYASDLREAGGVVVVARIPARCQPSIRYAAVAVAGTQHRALSQAFVDFAASPERDILWAAFGFQPSPSRTPLPER